MDLYSPLMSHTRRRRPSCSHAESADSAGKGSLLPFVMLVGGIIFAAGVLRDRKRVREAGGTQEGEQSEQQGGAKDEEQNGLAAWWQNIKSFVWRPAPTLSFKGRACGPVEGAVDEREGTQTQDAEAGEVEGGAAALLVTNVGTCSLSKFEERWTMLSRSSLCSFTPTSGPAGATVQVNSPAEVAQCGWQLVVGPSHRPLIAADVSGDLQLHEVDGETAVKFKWDGGFWSLHFSSRSTLATFLAAFKAKQAAVRKLLTSRSDPAAAGSRLDGRRGGDVRIEDMLS